jgi:hypothetical protein
MYISLNLHVCCPVSRPDDDRRLDVQISPCDFDSNLDDLLPDRSPYLLPVAGLSENGRILPLANFDPAANREISKAPEKIRSAPP